MSQNYKFAVKEPIFESSQTLILYLESDEKDPLIAKVAVQQPPDEFTVESYKRDFQFSKTLFGHYPESFVDSLDLVEENNMVMIVQKNEDDSFTEFLKKTGALDLERFLELAIHMCKALENLHSLNVIHRDIKLPKLIDFGISTFVSRKSPSITCTKPIDDIPGLATFSTELKKKVTQETEKIGGFKNILQLKKCENEEIEILQSILAESIDILFLSPLSHPLMKVIGPLLSLHLFLLHGLTANSITSLAVAAWIFGFFFNEPDSYELAKAAEKLYSKTLNSDTGCNMAIVQFALGLSQQYGGTLKQMLYFLDAGSSYAISNNEYVFGSYDMSVWGFGILMNGQHYPKHISKMKNHQKWLLKKKNYFGHATVELNRSFMEDLMGIKDYDPKYNENILNFEQLVFNRVLAPLMRAMLHYFYYEQSKTIEELENVEEYFQEASGMPCSYGIFLYYSLALIHRYKQTKDKKSLEKVKDFIETFRKLANVYDIFFTPRLGLLETVLQAAISESNKYEILSSFENVIESSQQRGFYLITAIALESTLEFCIERNFPDGTSVHYYHNLISMWGTIGGKKKIQKIKAKYAQYSRKLSSSSLSNVPTSGKLISLGILTRPVMSITEEEDFIKDVETFEDLKLRENLMRGIVLNLDLEQEEVQGLIIVPTNESAQDTQKMIKEIGKYMNVKSKVVVDGDFVNEKNSDLQKGVDIILSTPERLGAFIKEGYVDLSRVNIVVFDEVNELIDKGFKDQILTDFTDEYLNHPFSVIIKDYTLDEMKHFYIDVQKEENKTQVLFDILETYKILFYIYVNSIEKLTELSLELMNKNISVHTLTHEKDDEVNLILKNFKNGILITTDKYSRYIRGIHCISAFINYDIPKNKHYFLDRIGKSGEFGRKRHIINFMTVENTKELKNFELCYQISI
eukprot:gene2678-3874_t